MNYDVNYFIKKFEAIPEHLIGLSQETGCAFGQCRSKNNRDGSDTKEGRKLAKLLMSIPDLEPIDGCVWGPYYNSSTPARINNGTRNRTEKSIRRSDAIIEPGKSFGTL